MGSALSLGKRIFNEILGKVGHQLVTKRSVPSFERLVSHLERAGIAPVEIFDVGIATGTPWLYEAYPDAKYYLFDPTPESLPFMNEIAQKLDAEVFNIALGASESTVTIRVRPEHAGSTLFEEVEGDEVSKSVEVPMKRFDSEFSHIPKPSLMKIDVQGAEIMVLEGMGERLKDIDCFIVETSLIATLQGSPEFAELNAFMDSNEYVLYDIINLGRRPLDEALAQIDAVYVPISSPLRADLRWGK